LPEIIVLLFSSNEDLPVDWIIDFVLQVVYLMNLKLEEKENIKHA
jgi:hypothetical protein